MKNKITKVLFILSAIFIFAGCGKEEAQYSIPWAPVNFQLNLNGLDNILNGGGGFKTFTAPRIGSDKVGVSGLLVVNSGNIVNGNIELWAYDLCCPKEKQKSIVITPDNDGIKARCATCKSVFEILNGSGIPVSGPAEDRLQTYRVIPGGGASGSFRVVN